MPYQPSPPPHRLQPALALRSELRRRAARLRVSAESLTHLLLATFPAAHLLLRDPTIAEHTHTTPYDHLAADTVAAVQHLLDTLAELAKPIHVQGTADSPGDQQDF